MSILNFDADGESLRACIPLLGAVVAIAEVYIDESGTHNASPIMCLAGYVFCRRKALEFQRKHAADLRVTGVPYFHAKECNPDPGNGAFASLNKNERIEFQSRLIQRVKTYSEYSFAISLNERDFMDAQINKPNTFGQSAYAFLLWGCLHAVRTWIDQSRFDGKISYMFEAGHRHQAIANRTMSAIQNNDFSRHKYLLDSFGFHRKESRSPLQAADLLAWHFQIDYKRNARGKARRKDFSALLRPIDRVAFYPRDGLSELSLKMKTKGLIPWT